MSSDHSQQLGPVGRGDAEHVADHDDGQRRRDVGHEVAAALLAHLVDDGVADETQTCSSMARTRLGVKPSETSRRRRTCSGASKSIIMGSGGNLGRMPWALRTPRCRPTPP